MAYTGNSIVDYLSSSGQKNDYATRAALAASKGISGYTGSAQQNTQLLNSLRGSGASAPTSSPSITAPGSSQATSGQNYTDILSAAQDQQRQAYQPVIQSLQSGIPTLQSGYQTQRKNLEDQRGTLQQQYDNLISGLKTQQTQDVNAQTLATNNELGKRGILGSSGAAQQEIINTTRPVNEYYANQIATTGNQGQQAQQQITSQEGQLTADEANAVQNIQNAIAQYQSTGNTNALQAAQQQFAQAQQSAQFNQNYALQQATLNNVTIPTAKAQITASNASAGLNSAQAQQIKLQNDPNYLKSIFGSLGIGSGESTGSNPLSSLNASQISSLSQFLKK